MAHPILIQPPRPGRAEGGVADHLAAARYVEEELIVQGSADLYTYDAQWNTVQLREALPYTTRLVVRRPSDAAAASGDAVIEPLHASNDMASAFGRVARAITREGMTWIGVTQDIQGLRALRRSDEDRYTKLSIPA